MSSTVFPAPTRGRFGPLVWAFLLLWALPRVAAAAAPINDTCAGAFNIPGAGPFPFYCPVVDMTSATNSLSEAALTNALCTCPRGHVSKGIWFKFRPLSNALYTVTTLAPATTVEDTVIAIYSSSGCGGTFLPVICNDDISDTELHSSVTTPLLADADYHVVVWLYGTAAPDAGKTNVQIVVTREVPPPNDTCLTALPVFLNTSVSGSTVLASNNYRLSGTNAFGGVGQRASAGMGRDVVYSFAAPETGDYSFKASAYKDAPNFDLMLYIGGYCAPGPGVQTLSGVLAASNRNHVGTAEEVMCVTLTNGQLVYIYVDDTNFNSGSTFILEVMRCVREAETNDTPATASRLAYGIEGSLFPAEDVDFYAVGSFPADWRLFAMVIGDAANTPPDFNLRVTTLYDTLEYDNDDNDLRFGQTSPNIAGTPLPGGPAFISVTGNSQFGLEPYQLYAVVQPPANVAAREIEPNNTLATATTSPANYFYGRLTGPSPSADEDLYQFSASDGDLVFVSLDADPTRDGSALNAQLELLDEFGNSLVLVNDGRSSSDISRTTNSLSAGNPDFPGEALVYRCAEGIYYVRVSIGTTSAGLSGSGDYLLSITRNGITGALGPSTAPTFVEITMTSPVVEGGTATLTGSVFDPDLGDSASLLIHWGDGSNDVVIFNAPGLNEFSVDHHYLDDAPTGTAADLFAIDITVMDSRGESAVTNSTVLVKNAPPQLLDVAVTSPVSVNSTAVLSGTILDPGLLDTFALAINWGDGSPAQHFSYPAGATSFNQTHAYGTGSTNFDIHLTLLDDDTGAASASVSILVRLQPQAAHLLGVSKLNNDHMLLQLEGTPLATYRIEVTDNLEAWTEAGSATADGAGALSFEDVSPAPFSRFYRAVAVP